jgi:hypothetical protein
MDLLDLKTFDVKSLFGGGSKQPATPSSGYDVRTFDPRSLNSSVDSVKSIISGAAQKYGVPADLLHGIAGAESSFDPNAGNKTGSSAKGLFQAIDSTWQGMGGRPGDQFDPVKNADFGARYTKQNISDLRNKLGRDPSYGEVYAAHHFGPGVANMINRSSPNAPIESGLSTFNNQKQVSKIMAQNPSLRGKTVGQVMDSLQQKVGNKIVAPDRRAEANIDDQTTGEEPTQVAQADDNYADAWLDDSLGQQQVA